MRWILAVAALLALMAGATMLKAQAAPRTLADSLEAARRQRLALEAALERQLATGIAERTRTLSMSEETGALQRLEVMLDSTQVRLLAQRDRIRLLRDAATQTDKAILVVLLRADVAPTGEVNAVVTVDGAQGKPQVFPVASAQAQLVSAASELYRAEMAPGDHRVVISVIAPGVAASEPLVVPMGAREVRYIEYAIRGGRVVPTTWTARAGSP